MHGSIHSPITYRVLLLSKDIYTGTNSIAAVTCLCLPRVQVEALYMDSDEAVVARYQHKLVECTDPNNNTPLSEAAAGGDPDTIR